MEIKVRVWDTNENRMVYDAQNTYDYGCSGVPIWEDSFQDVNESDEYIKMLYVGIKDKDNKEIYEGDIVQIIVFDEFDKDNVLIEQGVIEFDEDELTWLLRQPDSYWFINPLVNKNKQYRVIGNIYENSNLLK